MHYAPMHSMHLYIYTLRTYILCTYILYIFYAPMHYGGILYAPMHSRLKALCKATQKVYDLDKVFTVQLIMIVQNIT